MDMDFAVSGPLVRRSRLLSGSCPSARTFAPRFLQTPPRGDSPCALLTLHLHQVGWRTFTSKLLSMPGTQRSRCRGIGDRCKVGRSAGMITVRRDAVRTQGRAPKGGRNQRDRKAVGSSSRLEARFPSRRGCQMRHFAGEWFARPQRHVPYSTLAIRSGNQYGLGFRYTQVLGRGIPLNASLELAGRIRHDHKASQSRARQFQTKIERLIEPTQHRARHLVG